MLEWHLVNEEEEEDEKKEHYLLTRTKTIFFSLYLCWNIKLQTKRNKSAHIPAANFNRGCSLLIRIKSAEFKLVKLVESSIYICIQNVYL
jgi:hypothetical protein